MTIPAETPPQIPPQAPESTQPTLKVIKPLPTSEKPLNRTPEEIYTDFNNFCAENIHKIITEKKIIGFDSQSKYWREEKNISDDDWQKFLEWKTELNRRAEEEKKLEEERKFKEKQRRIAEIIKSSRVPKIFRDKSKKDFVITDKNENVVQCLKAINNNQGFYIYGECGTGKTLLASIIQNERAHLLKPSAFICATDIFSELNPFNSNNEEVARKLSLLKTTPCLIIDDLGVEKPTDRVKQNLFDIINYRYNEDLQTIITSNFSLEELGARISGVSPAEIGKKKVADYEGNRIIRRISAICTVIKLERY